MADYTKANDIAQDTTYYPGRWPFPTGCPEPETDDPVGSIKKEPACIPGPKRNISSGEDAILFKDVPC